MMVYRSILFLSFWILLSCTTESTATILAKKGQNVHATVDSLSIGVRITLEKNSTTIIKEEYQVAVKPGYKYTIKGSRGILDIFDFGPEKEGVYVFTFLFPDGKIVKRTVEVLMADLACALRFPDEFISETDCPGFPRDKIEGWCQLKLKQSRKVEIKWKVLNGGKTKNEGTMGKLIKNGGYVDAIEPDVRLEEGDVFQCYTDHLRCDRAFEPKNVIFAKNKTKERLNTENIMTQNNKHPTTCRAITNPTMACSYAWWHDGGPIQDIIQGDTLLERDLRMPGAYDCIATCYPKRSSNEECVLLADRVQYLVSKPLFDFDGLKKKWKKVNEDSTLTGLEGWVIILIVLVFLSLIILGAVFCARRCLKPKYTNVAPTMPSAPPPLYPVLNVEQELYKYPSVPEPSFKAPPPLNPVLNVEQKLCQYPNVPEQSFKVPPPVYPVLNVEQEFCKYPRAPEQSLKGAL